MKTKVKKIRRSKEEMIFYIKEWRASGESKKSFCARYGIAPSVLQYWHSKLENQDTENQSGFVEVRPSSKTSAIIPIEVVFPSGARIVFSQDTDPSFIRSLVY